MNARVVVLALQAGLALGALDLQAQSPGLPRRPREASVVQPPAACCTITAIDVTAGVVSARITASGNVFQFKPANPSMLASLRVGQAVHANFATGQVSLDGRAVCCTVATAAVPPLTVGRSTVPAPTKTGGIAGPVTSTTRVSTLPRVTYGEPIPAPTTSAKQGGKLARVTMQVERATVGGRELSAQMLHLNGRQGIESSALPDGPKRLLEMHVRKLPLGGSQYYLVNPQLAEQWAATHPVPPDMKPKDPGGNDSDCGEVSINGIRDCGQDAADAVEAEFERARGHAQEWWDESTEKLADQYQEAVSCFADHELPGPTTPVKFSIAPSMTMDMKQSGARGEVTGSVTLGVPMQSDFQAQMKFFYIPCLPFVFRPKSITADGTLTVGQELALEVSAAGAFSKRLTIPPTGGPRIPLYVIPIVIGDIPVAVLDVSVYIEGEIDVKGEGSASGRFAISNSHRSAFDFACDGKGCSGEQKGTTAPTTTSESAEIKGQLSVQPGIYTALQLSLNYNVLQARAGPQPYLLGVTNGCAAAAAVQATDGSSSSTTSVALTADLDWGAKLRAEALAGGERIGNRWETRLMQNRHLWFRDLTPGGSSGLVAAVTGPAQIVAAQPSAIRVRMPTCYPYTSRVHYRVAWSGGATPAPNPACQWQAGSGTCWSDPARDLALTFTWPNAGTHSVSIQLTKDEHRTFSPAPPPARHDVTVAAAPGGGTP